MELVLWHSLDEDEEFICVFRAYVEDHEEPRLIPLERWELVAAIEADMVDTKESYEDWHKTIAMYAANRARYKGYQVGDTTYEEW